MGRGRPKAIADAAATAAHASIRQFVKENRLSAADLALYAGTSDASAWRVLHSVPARWTDSFVKIHEFIKCQQTTAPVMPHAIEIAVDDVVRGRRHATATLLRAIADMLERCPA